MKSILLFYVITLVSGYLILVFAFTGLKVETINHKVEDCEPKLTHKKKRFININQIWNERKKKFLIGWKLKQIQSISIQISWIGNRFIRMNQKQKCCKNFHEHWMIGSWNLFCLILHWDKEIQVKLFWNQINSRCSMNNLNSLEMYKNLKVNLFAISTLNDIWKSVCKNDNF